jgi:hypothetical protein
MHTTEPWPLARLRFWLTDNLAAMWDSHFRVGGAAGTDLTIKECPKFGYNEKCIAASLLFHVTSKGSGYFENVWVWTADQ